MALSCELIRDLIPLVKGRNASGESVRRVEEHLADCDACAQFYEACTPDKEKRSIRLVMFFLKLLTVGALAALGLWSREGFWSSTSLVASGAVAYFAFRRGRWILPLAVFLAAFATRFTQSWQSYGQFALEDFLRNLPYSFVRNILMPAVLVLGGMAAAFLIRFALRPRQKGDRLPILLKWSASIDRSSPGVRIAAGVGAVSLVAAAFLWMNPLYGNPVSSFIAENAMRNYLHERFSSYDLTYDNTWYSWADRSYRADISSPTDPDLAFTLTYNSDGRVMDSFVSQVASGENKLYRMETDLSMRLLSILKDRYGSSLLSVTLGSVRSPVQDSGQKLLDKALRGMTSLGVDEAPDLSIQITLMFSPMTPETTAEKLTECYNLLNAKGYVFGEYCISVRQKSLMNEGFVQGVTPEDIKSGNLISLLTAATLDQSGEPRIYYREPNDMSF